MGSGRIICGEGEATFDLQMSPSRDEGRRKSLANRDLHHHLLDDMENAEEIERGTRDHPCKLY